jgi:hypothetical protein
MHRCHDEIEASFASLAEWIGRYWHHWIRTT